MPNETPDTGKPQPSVGRVVHYFESNEGPFAAIVTKVDDASDNDQRVSLNVFHPISTYNVLKHSVPYNKPTANAYWCWPPRV